MPAQFVNDLLQQGMLGKPFSSILKMVVTLKERKNEWKNQRTDILERMFSCTALGNLFQMLYIHWGRRWRVNECISHPNQPYHRSSKSEVWALILLWLSSVGGTGGLCCGVVNPPSKLFRNISRRTYPMSFHNFYAPLWVLQSMN